MIIVRRAGDVDLEKVHGLFNRNLDKYFDQSAINFFMMQWPAGQFIAEDIFNTPAGAICCSVLTGGTVSISLLAVEPGFRNRGVGGRLLESVRNVCLMQGYSRIQLEVRTRNSNAINFYKNKGFVVSDFLSGYYNDGGDAYRMVCNVNSLA